MDYTGTPLSTFVVAFSIYVLGWLAVWYVVEWRFRVLCEHNRRKISPSLTLLLSKTERHTLLGVRLLMILTLLGSASVLYLLIL